MRKVLGLTIIASTISGCNTDISNIPGTGIANPASAYCTEQGGRIEIREDESGNQSGYCHLPDGTTVEEWSHFCQNRPDSQWCEFDNCLRNGGAINMEGNEYACEVPR